MMFRMRAHLTLIASGTDVRTVSGKFGHAQTPTTMNIYAHRLKSAEQKTAAALDSSSGLQQKKQNKHKKADQIGLLILLILYSLISTGIHF